MFRDVYSESNRHRIAPFGFNRNVSIEGLVGVGNDSCVNSHSGFNLTYRNVTDMQRGNEGIAARSGGMPLENIWVESHDGSASTDPLGQPLDAEYTDVMKSYDTIFRNVRSRTSTLKATQPKRTFIENCDVRLNLADKNSTPNQGDLYVSGNRVAVAATTDQRQSMGAMAVVSRSTRTRPAAAISLARSTIQTLATRMDGISKSSWIRT